MTDMRATARLLEVIQEKLIDLRDFDDPDSRFSAITGELIVTLDELRRRGDTLVRARDLELIVQVIARENLALGEDEVQAVNRLDGALGASL